MLREYLTDRYIYGIVFLCDIVCYLFGSKALTMHKYFLDVYVS